MSTTYSDSLAMLKRPGWLTFAAIIMFSVGFVRVITAISYFADSVRVNNLANGLFTTHTWVWGLWDLLIAALAFIAGSSLLRGDDFGRVFGYLWAVFMLVQGFLVLTWAPWYGAGAILVAILVIYAISVSADYQETV
jgi:hypothetical protein